jgi:hypothetical protein
MSILVKKRERNKKGETESPLLLFGECRGPHTARVAL